MESSRQSVLPLRQRMIVPLLCESQPDVDVQARSLCIQQGEVRLDIARFFKPLDSRQAG